jgi:multiple sugar transport system permease protein
MSRDYFEETIIRILRIAGLLIFIVMVGFPFYWMIVSSFKSLEEILLTPANLGLAMRSFMSTAFFVTSPTAYTSQPLLCFSL